MLMPCSRRHAMTSFRANTRQAPIRSLQADANWNTMPLGTWKLWRPGGIDELDGRLYSGCCQTDSCRRRRMSTGA